MPSVEDKEKVLSDYYKFWMNLKYNLGFSSAKNWKKPPSPYSSCKDGYSDNETLHDSGKCRKERFVNITRKQDQGWSTSDWFQFVLFCSLPTSISSFTLFYVNYTSCTATGSGLSLLAPLILSCSYRLIFYCLYRPRPGRKTKPSLKLFFFLLAGELVG